jgi:hypothetical protein
MTAHLVSAWTYHRMAAGPVSTWLGSMPSSAMEVNDRMIGQHMDQSQDDRSAHEPVTG